MVLKKRQFNFFLLLIIFIGLYMTYLKIKSNNQNILSNMLNYCLEHCQNNTIIDINKFVLFEWDTLYVVGGYTLSEFLYRDYNLTGPTHITEEDYISYYFTYKSRVIYIEDTNNCSEYVKNNNLIYLHDPLFDENRSRTPSAAKIFFKTSPLFKVSKSTNLDNTAYSNFILTEIIE